MRKLIVVAFIFIMAVISLFLFFKEEVLDDNNKTVTSIKENRTEQNIKKKVKSNLLALTKSLKQVSPKKMEVTFNEKTELTPMNFDEVAQLKGEALQKRVKELDAKLDAAIQKYPDLGPPPEWYTKEMAYLSDKFFKTIGKSKYKTEMTNKQKEKQQEYINYLHDLEDSGEVVSDKKLAKIKRTMLGEMK
ncbi:hypothetical protein KAH37_08140 [bacterium]|nr:hypothetical protein [bacterium]